VDKMLPRIRCVTTRESYPRNTMSTGSSKVLTHFQDRSEDSAPDQALTHFSG
jgi:hypothetical protein